MAKKSLLVLILAAFVAGGAFAVSLSAGLGGNFITHFDSYNFNDGNTLSKRTIGGGAFAFFDAKYVELNAGLLLGRMNYGDGNWGFGGQGGNETLNLTYLRFGLFGKIPFDLGVVSLFPMLGVQYDFGLDGRYENNNLFENSAKKADYMNRLWVKLGFGADINVARRVYFRPSVLYGLNFGSKDDRDMEYEFPNIRTFHHGLDARLALGLRF